MSPRLDPHSAVDSVANNNKDDSDDEDFLQESASNWSHSSDEEFLVLPTMRTSQIDANALRQGEADTIRKVLYAVQRHERERIQEGFNEINFAAGVLNSMLVAYVFGNFPEHFWLLWLLEAAALIPRKIWQDWHAQPLRQILYYLVSRD